jgi:ribosomal protein S18 acetylase RimI-like enzyme
VANFILRPAKPHDAQGIAEISRSVIEAGLQPTWPAQRVLRHIDDRESVVLTASVGTSLAGFAIMQFAETTAHLNLLAVLPDRQRRGIGRALLRWLEASAVTAGTFVISLELRATNATAREFYGACGYGQVGFVLGYYQGIDSAIRMSRDLRTRSPDSEPQR